MPTMIPRNMPERWAMLPVLFMGLPVKKPYAPRMSAIAQIMPARNIGIGRLNAQTGMKGRTMIRTPRTPKIAPEAPRDAP